MREAILLSCFAIFVPALGAERGYRAPRMPNGQPDLQGVWEHSNATPFTRPAGVASLVITREQATAIEQSVRAVMEDRATPTEPTEYFPERFFRPSKGELRSSIIIDPPDGQLPGTASFNQRLPAARAATLNAMDGPEERPSAERCIGNPASLPPHLPANTSQLHQLVQTRDTIVFVSEIFNTARIIRLNAKHAPTAVTSWSGDSIGWWEGDTLVVETTLFTPSDKIRAMPNVVFFVTPHTVVVERFKRVSDNELNYVFTVTDPAYYTRPWTGESHFFRSNDRILEYACHEGNDSLTLILRGARVQEGNWPPGTATPR
jgi:hypothetical protein